MLRVAAQNPADLSLFQRRGDIAEPFNEKLIMALIRMMRLRQKLKIDYHRLAETISGIDGGGERRIVERSLGALHPVHHAPSVRVRLSGATHVDPGIA